MPNQYPITFLPNAITGSVEMTAFLQNNLIYVQQGSSSITPTEILELFPTSKEIFYIFPESKSGKFCGTYTSDQVNNITYLLDPDEVRVAYANTAVS